MSVWVDVGTLEELRPGAVRVVDIHDEEVAVFNLDGEFFAIRNFCTHDGSPLVLPELDSADQIADGKITCPHHGAKFCIRTGAALSPPAYEDTPTFPVREINGIVQVRAISAWLLQGTEITPDT